MFNLPKSNFQINLRKNTKFLRKIMPKLPIKEYSFRDSYGNKDEKVSCTQTGW